jgi:long-chain acyl-CoA synthetase
MSQMMLTKEQNGWHSLSTDQFIDQVESTAQGLASWGIVPGDRVAIITHSNRWEWDVLDHAILQNGAVVVPIYPTMTAQDFLYILNHSQARMVLVSDQELLNKVLEIQAELTAKPALFSFEPCASIPLWNTLQRKEDFLYNIVSDRRAAVNELDLATIIYTSGTTGLPKGVMLSHRNIVSSALDSEERLPELVKGQSVAVSFLPICHIFERMLHYMYMQNGVTICMTGMDAIKDDLVHCQPHIFTAVPRLLEKVYDGVVQKGMKNKGIKKWLFQWALSLAHEWESSGKSAWYHFQLNLARRIVFSKVKEALGLTRVAAIASGSAALQPRLARFFNAAGMVVLEGYGLTETSPVISVNTTRTPDMLRVGSVGKPLKTVEVKIMEDGEIAVKGPNVMMGYYQQPELTMEVLKDGWFFTGDIGEFRDGFLVITDRKKEMFKTSGGKYVAPQSIENALKESLFIEQCMVVGEGEKFAGALIVPDKVSLSSHAKKENIEIDEKGIWLCHPAMEKLIWKDILHINQRFGKWEQVKAIQIVHEPFSIDKGEITPTLKLKRKKIVENYRHLIENMFRSHKE